MRKVFFFIIFLLVLIVLPIVKANSVGIGNNYKIDIIEWREHEFIENNNLKVIMIIELYIKDKDISDFIFKIDPTENEHPNSIVDNLKFYICEEYKCTKVKPKLVNKDGYYHFNISLDEYTLKNDVLEVKINYTLKNFLDKNDDKLIILNTICEKGGLRECSAQQRIKKYVYLPLNTAVRIYPPNSILRREGSTGRLYIELNNFTENDKKAILFTDLKQIRNREKFLFVLAILLTFFISLGLQHYYYKKLKKKNNEEGEYKMPKKLDLIDAEIQKTRFEIGYEKHKFSGAYYFIPPIIALFIWGLSKQIKIGIWIGSISTIVLVIFMMIYDNIIRRKFKHLIELANEKNGILNKSKKKK